MSIKDSAKVGPAVASLLEQEGMTGKEMAADLNVSEQLTSHYKHNRRNMHREIAQASMDCYDNPEYRMDLLFEFSSGYTPPVLRGRNIEQHRLSYEAHTERELAEAIDVIKKVCLARPPQSLSKDELEGVKEIVDELLDVRTLTDNFLKQLQVEYGISITERIKAMMPRWKARGWLV
ncbi:hypothetical protein [Indiicoccus explosivorum]|uniref:hypothetical protein n=1 Tax=Indiicoccus explosivorum TaxID=1917864 RepID=UPI000B445AB7|nr:hypothetical protein [Indiicoccus explosivorum]